MSNSNERDEKRSRNRADRHRQIREWAAYVRSHPDEEWGEQVNKLVNSQLQSARHFEDERPDMQELRKSPLFDE